MISKGDIKRRLQKGDVKKAIEQLLQLTEASNMYLHEEVVMLSARYNSLTKVINAGAISEENADLRRNKITLAILQTLNDLGNDQEDGSRSDIQKAADDNREIQVVKEVVTILFLASNPIDTSPLKLDQEVRRIEEGLRRGKNRDMFRFVQKWAIRIKDLRRALLEEVPKVVHFSGHGSSNGKIFLQNDTEEAKPLENSALGNLFRLFQENIDCIVLNACYSEQQAREIAKHIKFVVGMNASIPDQAAIEFSEAFYDALASGRDIKFAFEIAVNAIELYGIDAQDIPVLIHN